MWEVLIATGLPGTFILEGFQKLGEKESNLYRKFVMKIRGKGLEEAV